MNELKTFISKIQILAGNHMPQTDKKKSKSQNGRAPTDQNIA